MPLTHTTQDECACGAAAAPEVVNAIVYRSCDLQRSCVYGAHRRLKKRHSFAPYVLGLDMCGSLHQDLARVSERLLPFAHHEQRCGQGTTAARWAIAPRRTMALHPRTAVRWGTVPCWADRSGTRLTQRRRARRAPGATLESKSALAVPGHKLARWGHRSRPHDMLLRGYRRVPVVLLLCLMLHVGCASGRLPRIDPTGERIFAPSTVEFEAQPGLPEYCHNAAVRVSPRKVVAPLGSEVVVLASVCGPDGYMYANQRVEWSLAEGSVGHFVAVNERTVLDALFNWSTSPHKVDAGYAVGSTSSRFVVLTRGTPQRDDDVTVLRGQAWVSLTSPVEGTSYVMAFAPSVYAWDQRQETAIVHWVDAQFAFPAPAIATAGSRQVLTTTVTRATDGTPLTGWRVRYQITAGPNAGFAPDGAASAVSVTDSLGQATVELFQPRPAEGTNLISIQVLQPIERGEGTNDVVLATASTQVTWTVPPTMPEPAVPPTTPLPGAPPPAPGAPGAPSPQPAPAEHDTLILDATGPEAAELGEQVSLQIAITNRGRSPARGLVLVARGTPALRHETGEDTLERSLPEIAAGTTHRAAITYTAVRQERACVTFELFHGQTVVASDQVCVQVVPAQAAAGEPRLAVRKTGPQRSRVGEIASFVIEITNTGTGPATAVRVADHYDASLDPVRAREGYEFVGDDLVWNFTRLEPGARLRIRIDCRCIARAQPSCNRVTVTCREGVRADGEACLTIEGGPEGLSTTLSDVRDPVTVGRQTAYEIRVVNEGQRAAEALVVSLELPPELEPLMVGTVGPGRYEIRGNTVRFDPVATLAAGQSLTYRVEVRARRAGTARVRARLESRTLSQPVTVEESTTVLAE